MFWPIQSSVEPCYDKNIRSFQTLQCCWATQHCGCSGISAVILHAILFEVWSSLCFLNGVPTFQLIIIWSVGPERDLLGHQWLITITLLHLPCTARREFSLNDHVNNSPLLLQFTFPDLAIHITYLCPGCHLFHPHIFQSCQIPKCCSVTFGECNRQYSKLSIVFLHCLPFFQEHTVCIVFDAFFQCSTAESSANNIYHLWLRICV